MLLPFSVLCDQHRAKENLVTLVKCLRLLRKRRTFLFVLILVLFFVLFFLVFSYFILSHLQHKDVSTVLVALTAGGGCGLIYFLFVRLRRVENRYEKLVAYFVQFRMHRFLDDHLFIRRY